MHSQSNLLHGTPLPPLHYQQNVEDFQPSKTAFDNSNDEEVVAVAHEQNFGGMCH